MKYLKQGTKIKSSGFHGTIVRHYNGSQYEIRLPGGVKCTDEFEVSATTADIIKLIKKYGSLESGIFYPASQQVHKLPELFASEERISFSFYIEVDEISFFVEETPGNINGSAFHVYYDTPVLPIATTNKVRSIIKNNQDAIGICFHNVFLN